MSHRMGPALAPAVAFLLSSAAAGQPLPATDDGAAAFARLAALPEDARCAGPEVVSLAVVPEAGAGPEAVADAAAGHLQLLYRTAFNQVTEGWNWHPEADAQAEDYYRFKYLPLGSTVEERAGYRFEDKPGEPRDMRVAWRYDYFLAFDNLYDFMPRGGGDDAGFAARVPLPAGGTAAPTVGLAARALLSPRCLAESTTFWKATHARPVDFTLKKRYLVGRLLEVWFFDAADGRVLARLPARGGAP